MANRGVICCDWDGTLVDQDGEWLPGAQDRLRTWRRRGYTVVIHSCRANWPQGLAQIEAKLARHNISLEIAAKPQAVAYVDDKAVRFTGDWADIPLTF